MIVSVVMKNRSICWKKIWLMKYWTSFVWNQVQVQKKFGKMNITHSCPMVHFIQKWDNVTTVRHALCICVIMANFNYPYFPMHWDAKWHVPCIANVSSQKMFLLFFAKLPIKSHKNSHEGNKKYYWNVQLLIRTTQSDCKSLSLDEHHSINEVIIRFCGRATCHQYVKNKPNQDGVFVRCGRSGIACNFEFYLGKGSSISEEHKEPRLGSSVMRLAKNLTENLILSL